ncbi:hypothetical protein [Collinsella tanakaei]|uniref:hypothetical protein n=1 Tax=Collinsella tanakaei TaxID=626935 RepID=UPI003AB7A187
MSICICNASALEALRSSGRLLPTLLDGPRCSQLDDTPVPHPIMLHDDMVRIGLKEGPYHILVPTKRLRYARGDVIFHTRKHPLPFQTLLRSEHGGPILTGPELLFCDLALSPDYDTIDLIELGYELCGTYLINDCWDGYISNAVCATSTDKIRRVVDNLTGRPGIDVARKALRHVRDGSNSPMETALAMMLNLPKHLGGQNLGPISLNHPVVTPQGTKYVDVAFPEPKVGLEYKGRDAHSIEKTARDDRRQNTLLGSGWTILSVWYEDLVQDQLYSKFLQELAKMLHVRLRTRSEYHETMIKVLRARLLPALEKYSQ